MSHRKNVTKGWGSTVQLILNALDECGELTAREMCDHIEVDRDNLSTILCRMSKELPKVPKRIYVVRYVSDAEGLRKYPRPVYALGNLPDAKKPKSNLKEIRRAYRQRVRMKMTANSVFNLARTRQEYKELRKAA